MFVALFPVTRDMFQKLIATPWEVHLLVMNAPVLIAAIQAYQLDFLWLPPP